MNTVHDNLLRNSIRKFENLGLPVPVYAHEKLWQHLDLVREWNPVCSLVSEADAAEGLEAHVADSLGLAVILHSLGIEEGLLLDIGSGGGFPAIPLKIMIPELSVLLIERSSKKSGFLAKAIASLDLRDVRCVSGRFPEDLPSILPQVVTSRAIERPSSVIRDICTALPSGSVYLCQSGDPSESIAEGCTVKRSCDSWKDTGYRRGSVYIVRCESAGPSTDT